MKRKKCYLIFKNMWVMKFYKPLGFVASNWCKTNLKLLKDSLLNYLGKEELISN